MSIYKLDSLINAYKTIRRNNFINTVLAFGLYQLVIAITTYFRIPTVSRNSRITSVGAWFFWLNFLTWLPMIYAAQSNLSRIRSLNKEPVRYKMQYRTSKLSLSILALLAALFVILAFRNSNLFVSMLPMLLSFLFAWHFGWVLGFVAGIHQIRKLYYFSALISILVFIVIINIAPTTWWRNLPSAVQALVLVATSCLTTLSPMILPFSARFKKKNPLPIEKIFLTTRDWIRETLATTPPAFFQGFSALSIILTNKQSLLFSYGIVNRIQLIALVYSASISIPLYNYLNNALFSSYAKFLRTTIYCTLPILPVEILLFAFGGSLSSYLSAGKATISNYSVAAAISVGLVLPAWLAAAAWMTRTDENRRLLSKLMIRYVLPFSFLSSLLFTNFFGVTGNYISVSLTYILATIKLNLDIRLQMKSPSHD